MQMATFLITISNEMIYVNLADCTLFEGVRNCGRAVEATFIGCSSGMATGENIWEPVATQYVAEIRPVVTPYQGEHQG